MNEQLPIQMSLDVSLPERAQRIRDLVGVARTCIIEIGRELIAARREIHGERQWEIWLDVEFGWAETAAKKFIAVAKAFSDPSIVTNDLTIDATALYALSAPDVPQEARDEAIERAEDGEHISKADAEALIVAAMQAERTKFEAIIAELQASAEATDDAAALDIPTIVDHLCKATGRKKLKPAQFQHLACILGSAITDGSKVYPPSTMEESRQAEERLRVSAPAMRALEYFLAAPEPEVVVDALRPFQADTVRRCVGVARTWLVVLEEHLGEP